MSKKELEKCEKIGIKVKRHSQYKIASAKKTAQSLSLNM